MSIYISYHPLDYDFAFDLLMYIRNLGHFGTLCASDHCQTSDLKPLPQDTLIAILSPEYLQTADYSSLVGSLDNFSNILPVLRVPISIEEWSTDMVFRPVADFTSNDQDINKENLILLHEALRATGEQSIQPTRKETYLNKLEQTLRAYNRPLARLEHINYAVDPITRTPQATFYGKVCLK